MFSLKTNYHAAHLPLRLHLPPLPHPPLPCPLFSTSTSSSLRLPRPPIPSLFHRFSLPSDRAFGFPLLPIIFVFFYSSSSLPSFLSSSSSLFVLGLSSCPPFLLHSSISFYHPLRHWQSPSSSAVLFLRILSFSILSSFSPFSYPHFLALPLNGLIFILLPFHFLPSFDLFLGSSFHLPSPLSSFYTQASHFIRFSP